jgi:hypothetical protein
VNDVNQNTAGRERTAGFSVDRGRVGGTGSGWGGESEEGEDNKRRERKQQGRKRLSSRSERSVKRWTGGFPGVVQD